MTNTTHEGLDSNQVILDFAPDRSSPIPLYLQLAQSIENSIESGVLHIGSRIENEVGMSTRLKLSRPTVRQGIQTLVDKGVLVRKRGVGTLVVGTHVNRQVALTSLFDDLSISGRKPQTKVLEYRIGAPNVEDTDRLALDRGAQVLEITRLRLVDNEPLALMHNVLPEDIAPTRSELKDMGLYAALRSRGVHFAVAHQTIGATVADADTACMLNVEPGSALLIMDRKVLANDGSIIELGHHLYPASRYSFKTTLVD
ncbi:GntR family transcriptional regulator [Corynebacterium sp. SA-MJD20WY100]|uniref:GntR family transcriptional regulator n=1 Tax=Corynebacterium sp. SA-MJD20WY100 TaxID=3142969 RepID=UPI0032213ECA